jgi:hypothetical protein
LDPTPIRSVARRRSARYAARQRQRFFRLLLWCSVGLVFLAFGAGFALTVDRLRASAPDAEVGYKVEQRVQSLRLLDRAVEAKFNELLSEAARFAFEARQVDDATPGVHIFIGELALEQEEIDVMGSSARAALRRQPVSANAKLLLALQAWILRAQTGTAEAGAAAAQLLQEAATDELSNGAVRFFAGDFLMAIGRPAVAYTELLGALHRQHAWHSAAILSAKIWLASREASQVDGAGDTALDDFGRVAATLQRAVSSEADIDDAIDAVGRVFSEKQALLLLADPSLASGGSPMSRR